MGLKISTIFNRLFCKRPIRILMVSAPEAGKTTMLLKLLGQLGDFKPIPTIAIYDEILVYKNIPCTVFDTGGGCKIRRHWVHLVEKPDAVILVVDSNDRESLYEAEDELRNILWENNVKNSVLLIFANKQDLPNSLSVAELIDRLKLNTENKIKDRSWHIQPSSAIQGSGLNEGLDWMLNEMAKQYYSYRVMLFYNKLCNFFKR